MKKKCVLMMLIAIMTASLAGCGSSKDGSGKSVKLDPDHPVSLTIWHYYNGAQQAMFDTLVKEFNASVQRAVDCFLKVGYGTLTVALHVRSWIILWLTRQRLIKMPWTLQSQTERAGKRLLHSI